MKLYDTKLKITLKRLIFTEDFIVVHVDLFSRIGSFQIFRVEKFSRMPNGSRYITV